WQPAYVYITIFNNNVCWYPLGYNYRYYNYNRHYYGRHDDRRNPPPTGGGISPSPTPGRGPVLSQINEERRRRGHTPPFQNLRPGSVVTVPTDEFGKGRTGIRRAPLEVAREVLSKVPNEAQTPPILPSREQVEPKLSKEIRAETPPIARIDTTVKTGAAD